MPDGGAGPGAEDGGGERAALRRAARGGLCGGCSRARLVTSARGSVFVLCGAAGEGRGLPKYPPMPVLRCPAFAPLEPSA